MIAQERYEALVDALGAAYHHAQELQDSLDDGAAVTTADERLYQPNVLPTVRRDLWHVATLLGAQKAVLERARQT